MTLSSGSESLDKAYDDAIEQIKGQLPQDSELATNTLSWIIHAQSLEQVLDSVQIHWKLLLDKGAEANTQGIE